MAFPLIVPKSMGRQMNIFSKHFVIVIVNPERLGLGVDVSL